jgi:DNA-binding CsgD family transcriptional regulator
MVGDTNEEIAEALDVTEFTIRFILSDIYRRFTEKYETEQCTL